MAISRNTMGLEYTENIVGFPVTTKNKEACVQQFFSWINGGEKGRYFVCANPHCIEVAMVDSFYKQAMLDSDMITPDGVGIIIASWILKRKIRQRVTGSDIFIKLSHKLNKHKGHRYFFLGSTMEKLERLCDKVKNDFPNITIAGSYSPPFKTEFNYEENKIMVEMINQACPDVLWIGMTAPKQEKWIYQNRKNLNVKFIAPVGAVFDFYIKTVKRSSPIFLRLGLEWLPRLVREPRRLWRRMFVSAPKFMVRVIKQKIQTKQLAL